MDTEEEIRRKGRGEIVTVTVVCNKGRLIVEGLHIVYLSG